MKKLLRGLLAFAVLSSAALASYANDPTTNSPTPCLKLGADESLGHYYPAFEKIFTILYERAGYCFQSFSMAPKRIEEMMRQGDLDGDWFRPWEYIATRNLEQQVIPQAMFSLEARLLWLKDSGFSGNAQDLNGKIVGYPSGFRWLEKHIPLMGGKPFAVTTSSQVEALLTHGRIQVYATSSIHEQNLRESFGGDADLLTSAHWATEPFYHLLRPEHASKVPSINHEIRAMIASGEMATLLSMPGIVPAPLKPER